MRVEKFNWDNYQITSAMQLFIRDVSNCDDNAREYHFKKKTHQAIKQTNNRKQDNKQQNSISFELLLILIICL